MVSGLEKANSEVSNPKSTESKEKSFIISIESSKISFSLSNTVSIFTVSEIES